MLLAYLIDFTFHYFTRGIARHISTTRDAANDCLGLPAGVAEALRDAQLETSSSA